MDNKWYTLEINTVYEILNTSEKGLTKKEVKKRLIKYGDNKLPKKQIDSIFKIFIKQLLDPIELLLVATTFFSLLVGEVVDAIAIAFIIMMDLIIGTYQEWKAEKTAQSLSNLIKEKTKVIRNNEEYKIDTSKLVIGDIIVLEPGDKIGADARIIESTNLKTNESILTGESLDVVKTNEIFNEKTTLAERKNIIYAGTVVVTGRASGIVVETGIKTEIGKIANKVIHTKATKSPLTIRMEKFSRQISVLVIGIALLVATILFTKNVPGSEIFLSVVALSVSVMPEGLPLGMIMALTIASNKMAKNNVVVKRLNAVESLGSCTIIASDKTGTLTVNEQTAKRIVLKNGQEFLIEGIGYDYKGEIIDATEEAKNICLFGVINNEAHYEIKNNGYNYHGDSIDIAFLVLGKKANVDISNIEIIKEIPYESESKYSALFYKKDNQLYCTVKGSIEKILEFCNDNDKEKYIKQNEKLAKEGYRVIAIANGTSPNVDINMINNLTFEGLVAFIDPIREEVKEAIENCFTAGIKVVMITGDHPLTAFTISKELGLINNKKEVTTGNEIEIYFEKGKTVFDEFVKNKKVFARVTPTQKYELIESFKRQKEFVAVTGDGVNDAPALKSANIGIAMGSGTDVAKETASMIITDDNFRSIVSGIKEGRTAYSNIRKVSYMLLSCGVAEVLFFLLSIIFDLPMPLVAIQLLWLNIVTDGLQDFALSFEKSESDIMKEKPRNPKETIFNNDLFNETLLSGVTIGLLVFAVWVFLIDKVSLIEARTYIVFLMVFMQNIHVLNCRSEKQSVFKISIFDNKLIIFSITSAILLQLIFMKVPFLAQFLNIVEIPVIHILLLFLISIGVLIVMELYKMFKRKYK